MELRKIRYFIAAAEMENMHQAALRLHVSQPTLSQQIKELERELGVLLFERQLRRIHLTHAGRIFLDDARRIVADVDLAMLRVRRAQRGEIGCLRIAFNEIAEHHQFVSESLHRFRNAYPDIELSLLPVSSRQQLEAFRTRSIDAGFQYNQNLDPDLVDCLAIRADEFMLAVPSTHPLATSAKVHVADLKNQPFVSVSSNVNPLASGQLAAFFSSLGLFPKIVQEAQSALGQINLISAGMGIGFVPFAQRWEQSGAVVLRRVEETLPHLDFALAWRRDDISPHLAHLVEVVRASLATSAPVVDEPSSLQRKPEPSAPSP